jgi:hypothetical protein
MLLFRVLAGALLLLHPAAARAQAVWDMATEYPQNAMPGLGVTTFAKHVAEKSAGKLQISRLLWKGRSTIYPAPGFRHRGRPDRSDSHRRKL